MRAPKIEVSGKKKCIVDTYYLFPFAQAVWDVCRMYDDNSILETAARRNSWSSEMQGLFYHNRLSRNLTTW